MACGAMCAPIPALCWRWGRWRTPSSSISIFPGIPCWRRAARAFWGWSCRRTSTRPIFHALSKNSGGAGTCRCRPGCGITSIFPWAATGRARRASISTFWPPSPCPACGTARASPFSSGAFCTGCIRWRAPFWSPRAQKPMPCFISAAAEGLQACGSVCSPSFWCTRHGCFSVRPACRTPCMC